ncbi:MerR family transcriptional regulator [Bradyrhizobium sp. AUGA SZCCT0124]|uniref:MerR family transcriptional regulator n=1 Tax=unclassified Bradyrhizobium TaxID=2631580 RepID=UPI001BA9240C|nr:MerR family transcriptional regulator [Bradyrhizobium sp. AUGA SZCCT0124]MBR1309606.1 MerR family transcriptional regulator [Bradyrhizobium sp. AUGA SZCCT0051]MBR1339747.1 MerR family transcriptional regulator [Bradyrhizobium sp. AUGA SZCCT0105]MBR1354354.1 MerR family transcriptional regulator [Bradyrhizobium sp. AUGA SZCCT0045]
MRIQEAAHHLGVSARALRHYESAGLIVPRRNSNGYRSYSVLEIERAAWVKDLIAAGFSTRELRNLLTALEDGRRGARVSCSAVMQEKLDQIDRAIAALRKRRRALSRRLAEPDGGRSNNTRTSGPGDEDTQYPGETLPAARGPGRGRGLPRSPDWPADAASLRLSRI